jgi:hypothetical protein
MNRLAECTIWTSGFSDPAAYARENVALYWDAAAGWLNLPRRHEAGDNAR